MVNNGHIKKLWNWFDNNFLLIATAFLIAFIPLYPKIPLGEIIPGYIVRVRLEDFFVFGIFAWWFLQLIRKKIHWRTPLTLFIGAYLVVGLLSNILGVLVTHSIPAELLHFGKSTLHWMRHIQYFSLFFVAYAAVKNRRDAAILLGVILLTILAVVIYGYGQKYWYWPVYSTMNREFSKGVRLYLGPFARVQSTFAGHYDLGAYLAFFLPLVLAAYYSLGKTYASAEKWISGRWRTILQFLIGFTWLSGVWLLVMSGARSSFGGYIIGTGVVLLLFWRRRSLWWFLSRSFVVFLISGLLMFTVGDLSSRFIQLVDKNKYPQVHEAYAQYEKFKEDPSTVIALNLDMFKSGPPAGSKSLDELEKELNEQGMTRSDTQPTTERPQDVYADVPEKEFELDDPAATLAGDLIQKGDKLVKERVYSDCSLERSLSLCIRLETLWPRALQGFYNNPPFGSGYATLTKETVEQFTEAESTDNNYLRTLGENGALGFFFYYGALGLALWYSYRAFHQSTHPLHVALSAGLFGGLIGLMLNATYIDVFVASKVAYAMWATIGVAMALFVKDGLVAQQFAFDRKQRAEKTSELSALLQQVESEVQKKHGGEKGYLSSKKRRQKSTRKKKSVQRKK